MKRQTAAKLTAMLLSGLLIQADLQYPMVISDAHDDCSYLEEVFYDISNVTSTKPFQSELHVEKQVFEKKVNTYNADIRLLAQLVEAEAGNQGFRGKQLVADVVLNRVKSHKFPNSIAGVIYQRYQFSVIGDGRFARMANRVSKESLKAAQKEFLGPRIDTGILYFNSGSYCMNGRGTWKYKDHWFAY